MRTNFQAKQTTLTFFGPSLPKNGFWVAIQKTNVGIKISILEIPFVSIFKKKRQLWLFQPKFAQKWILGLEFQKSMSGFRISASNMPCVSIFSQNGPLIFFGLNLRKLPNYMQHFSSNNVEGVAERWVEVQMSWLEVGGGGWSWVEVGEWFSNTHVKKIFGWLNNLQWYC